MQEIATYLRAVLDIFNNLMSEVVGILTTGPEAFSDTLYNLTNVLATSFQAIGTTMVILFFFMNMISTYSSMTEMKRPEIIFKEIFRLVICNLVVVNAFPLVMKITTIGNSIILSGYNSAWQYTGAFAGLQLDSTLENALSNQNFGLLNLGIPQIVTVLVADVLLIAIAIAAIYMLVAAYGRIFQCYMYMAIAPIPLSTFACRGTADVGKHFLKSYCGVMLQGLILVLAMLIFSVFFQSGVAIDQNETDVVVMILKFGVFVLLRLFTLIGVIKSADHIVQQMLGL